MQYSLELQTSLGEKEENFDNKIENSSSRATKQVAVSIITYFRIVKKTTLETFRTIDSVILFEVLERN